MIFIKDLLFYSGENQSPKVLKIDSDRWRAVVLNSKARAHKSLITERKPDHNVGGYVRPMTLALYCLTRRRIVLSVSICRVPMVVYIHKISKRKTLLLR